MRSAAFLLAVPLAVSAVAQSPLPPLTPPLFRAADINGKPLAGGLLYTYAAGTTTPQVTYSDPAGLVPNTNPVVLDATGSARVYLAAGKSYRLALNNALNIQQWTVDQVQGLNLAVNTVAGQVIIPVYNGTDLGAQVNTAVTANCTNSAFPCNVVIPAQTRYTNWTTQISLGTNVTLSCPYSGASAVFPEGEQLNYNGSGVAIRLYGLSSSVTGCSIAVGNSTVAGIRAEGQYNTIEHVKISGGGSATQLIHGEGTEGLRVVNTDLLDFNGTGVYLTSTNDTFLEHITAYATPLSPTAVSLMLDSNANGTMTTHFSGGFSGLHGLVFQNKIDGGIAPQWFFGDDVTVDCATGDGVVFDQSLGGQDMGVRLINSWSAGNGQNCKTAAVYAANINGYHISGGQGITIQSSEIRANTGHGILVDSSNVRNLIVTGNHIYGNNFSSTSTAPATTNSGVQLNYGNQIVVSHNTFGNQPNVFGWQNWGVAAGPNITGLNFSDNVCDNDLKSGCGSTGSVSNLIQHGNVVANGSQYTVPNKLQGDLSVTTPFGASTNPPHVEPSFGQYNGYKQGFTSNLAYDFTRKLWVLGSDGAHNSGWGFLASTSSANWTYYSIPDSSTPTVEQTFSDAQLATYAQQVLNGDCVAPQVPHFVNGIAAFCGAP